MIFSFLRYDGSTALIIASHFDFEDIAIALLRAGADDAILDKLENTAAEVWFEESGNGKIDEWAAMKNQAAVMHRDGVDGTEGDIGFDKTRWVILFFLSDNLVLLLDYFVTEYIFFNN